MRQLALTPPDFMEGLDVAEVQRRIGVEADCVYGPITAAAVKDWKWRVGYPADHVTDRLGLQDLAWLLDKEPFPPEFGPRAAERAGTPRPAGRAIVLPLATSPGFVSEFRVRDAEGAPSSDGHKYHAAKDWFAPGGSTVRSPCAGRVVEVRPSRGNSGQIFGGVVKVEADADKRVWVFRHVEPSPLAVGQPVAAGQVLARVTKWRGGQSHAHIELWKSLAGGYRLQNMLDPMPLFVGA